MRIHFVCNPRAGRGRSFDLSAAIRREFIGHDVVISTELPKLPRPGPLRVEDLFWPAAKPAAPDLVVAVGGDGTVNRVINAVAGGEVPVGIIPRGSSNDLAGHLGIPTAFPEACRIIRCARLADIDLISVNGRYFATCGGFGLAADVARRANAWRSGSSPARGAAPRADSRHHRRRWICQLARRLGRRIYPLALLRELGDGWRPPVARVLCAGEDRAGAWFSLLISNQPRFGGFTASPLADHRDGRVDVCRMRAPSSRLRMLWIALQTYRGRAVACAEVSQRRAGELTILTEQPVRFFGDGEILDRGRLFRVQIHPRALWIVSPRGARAWSWWRRSQDQRQQLLQYYLRRPSCRPMTISA